MSVNRNVGFFKGLVDAVKVLSNKNNILMQPVSRIADQKTDYNMLKAAASVKDTYGADNVFHWGFHKWGDQNRLVGK